MGECYEALAPDGLVWKRGESGAGSSGHFLGRIRSWKLRPLSGENPELESEPAVVLLAVACDRRFKGIVENAKTDFRIELPVNTDKLF